MFFYFYNWAYRHPYWLKCRTTEEHLTLAPMPCHCQGEGQWYAVGIWWQFKVSKKKYWIHPHWTLPCSMCRTKFRATVSTHLKVKQNIWPVFFVSLASSVWTNWTRLYKQKQKNEFIYSSSLRWCVDCTIYILTLNGTSFLSIVK